MTKNTLFSATDVAVVPEEGVNTFTVVDFDTPIGLVIEPNRLNSKLLLVRKNKAGTGWVPVTDEKGNIHLSAQRKEVIISMPDAYGLIGYVEGSVLAYTITV